ncbi:MAG TPA: hypothetical protein VFP69_09230 [Streptomyces sp.]|nr:hypothetical protein [Streptomyces sp.]
MSDYADRTTVPEPDTAVIYLRAERPGGGPGPAVDEARAFAEERGLAVVDVVADPHGAPDEPCERAGWRRVRAMAARGEIDTVVLPLPTSLSPERTHELRYRETRWLLHHGVRLRYSGPAPGRPEDGVT